MGEVTQFECRRAQSAGQQQGPVPIYKGLNVDTFNLVGITFDPAKGDKTLEELGLDFKVSIRLDQDVLDGLRGLGAGWQTKANAALSRAQGVA
jgi:hypothetical protein